jgi:hypothetical protein
MLLVRCIPLKHSLTLSQTTSALREVSSLYTDNSMLVQHRWVNWSGSCVLLLLKIRRIRQVVMILLGSSCLSYGLSFGGGKLLCFILRVDRGVGAALDLHRGSLVRCIMMPILKIFPLLDNVSTCETHCTLIPDLSTLVIKNSLWIFKASSKLGIYGNLLLLRPTPEPSTRQHAWGVLLGRTCLALFEAPSDLDKVT